MKLTRRRFGIFSFAAISMLLLLNIGCEKERLLEPEVELRSAQRGKISYIVLLEDAELNSHLSSLRGYEMKQIAMQSAALRILTRAGIADGEVEHLYSTALQGFSINIPPGQIKKLENDPAVVSVTEDKLITLIKPGTEEVSITSTQVTPWGITRVNGGVTYVGNNVAWVIDTGIDLYHPDLNVDKNRGKTFVTRTSTPNDDNGHGTHVAGTIAAIDNAEGVVGVAAGATVIPVKVLDRRGSGYMSWIIGGVDYVATNGKSGDVANMSLGGSKYDLLNDAVIAAAAKGIKFSLAAGNESTHAGTRSPASAEGDNIYTISAMAQDDLWASYSNYGNPPVDYCAPGSSIYSTYKNGGYATASGTSMAAPHVAGLLLLGNTKTDGKVINDPDGNPDPVLVYNGTVTPPPSNVAPIANFAHSVSGLTVNFTDTSSDSDGNVVAWSWNFGDDKTSTVQNPGHTYAAGGTYNVTLTVTDNNGATGSASQSVTVSASTGDGITLTATGYKVKGRQHADLSWKGTTSSVDIYRDGNIVESSFEGTEYTDYIGYVGGGSYTYKVCETGTSVCSNDATVLF